MFNPCRWNFQPERHIIHYGIVDEEGHLGCIARMLPIVIFLVCLKMFNLLCSSLTCLVPSMTGPLWALPSLLILSPKVFRQSFWPWISFWLNSFETVFQDLFVVLQKRDLLVIGRLPSNCNMFGYNDKYYNLMCYDTPAYKI